MIAVATRSLGWLGGDADERFFVWKHLENPFGTSPMWLALVDDRVVGFRVFLRWELREPSGGTVAAVRAVDTATHPDFQGHGIFSRLTMHGLDEMRADGIALVFNTPNEKSRPGYLKMGWTVVGRPDLHVRPASIRVLPRLVAARTAASKDAIPAAAGDSAADVFSDEPATRRLLASVGQGSHWTTNRTPAHLAWRYGFAPLHYRVVTHTSSLEDGLAVFHLRRRGPATEATVCEVLVPDRAEKVERSLIRRVASSTSADYLLRLDRRRVVPGSIPVPRAGPVLTMRSVDGRPLPRMKDLALTMGDIELF
jgi:GNAT superfamily N-acetyltransferase